MKWLDSLKLIVPENQIKLHEPLKNYTTFQVGGPCDALVMPRSVDEVKEIAAFAKAESVPLFFLGNGSNLLVRDGGLRGIVMYFGEMNDAFIEGTRARVEAGASLKEVTRVLMENELSGMEFACGIPGSVGGALYMNAGAYGGQMQDVVAEITVLNTRGEVETLSRDSLSWGYRKSTMMAEGHIVLEGVLQLEKGGRSEISAKMEGLMAQRYAKQPLEYPSAGSVFKRPAGYFAGKLIQDSGLQGVKIGGAQVSTKHAGFIVNVGGATAGDVLSLIRHIQAVVLEKFGVTMETEVRIVGEEL